MYGKVKTIIKVSDKGFHDISNYLQGIIGRAEILQMKIRRGELSEELLKEALEIILKTGLGAKEKISEARGFLRGEIEAARKRTIYKPEKLLAYFTGHIAAQAENFGMDYSLERFDLENRKISINESGLFNVVVNLFQNSRHAGAKNIWQHVWNDANYVLMSFRDDGRGMTEEVKRRCLESGFTTKPEGVGTGVGLDTLNEYSAENNGFVDIESKLGRGTTITLALSKQLCYPSIKAGAELK